MNTQSNSSSRIPWVKIGLIVAVVVLVGVFSGRSGLEEIFGLEPGTLGGTRVVDKDDSADEPGPTDASLDADESKSSQSAKKTERKKTEPKPATKPFELKKNGFVFESPQGLTYYVGDRGENRIDHIMRHAKDIPSRRGSHGVFVGSKDEIFRTIDEAYSLIQSNSSQVVDRKRDEKIASRMAYEVDMKRKIGYKGGKSGGAQGNPDLRTLKLILDKGTRVITAYPYR